MFLPHEEATGQILTVRLLIPSENTPICLTVTSESSICQQDEQTFKSGTRVKRRADVCPHLVQIVPINVDLPPLEAAALGHVHVHGADVVLAVVMAFPSQTAKAAKRQTSRL